MKFHDRTDINTYTLRANGIYFSIQVQKQLRIMAPFRTLRTLAPVHSTELFPSFSANQCSLSQHLVADQPGLVGSAETQLDIE